MGCGFGRAASRSSLLLVQSTSTSVEILDSGVGGCGLAPLLFLLLFLLRVGRCLRTVRPVAPSAKTLFSIACLLFLPAALATAPPKIVRIIGGLATRMAVFHFKIKSPMF